MTRLLLGTLVVGMTLGMALDETLRAHPRPWVFVFAFAWGLLALLEVRVHRGVAEAGEDE